MDGMGRTWEPSVMPLATSPFSVAYFASQVCSAENHGVMSMIKGFSINFNTLGQQQLWNPDRVRRHRWLCRLDIDFADWEKKLGSCTRWTEWLTLGEQGWTP
jgi:hypothetical protein